MPRIIKTQADIAEGVRVLTAACEHMAGVYDVTGLPPLRRRAPGFEGLARIITGQQLSVASASAIWGRVEKAVKPMDPETWLRKRVPTLRKCGLSAGKVSTIQTIAEAIATDTLDLNALAPALSGPDALQVLPISERGTIGAPVSLRRPTQGSIAFTVTADAFKYYITRPKRGR